MIFINKISYALKTLCFFDARENTSIENEINLMKMIDHDHIVKCYGDFVHSREIHCILMELCDVINH